MIHKSQKRIQSKTPPRKKISKAWIIRWVSYGGHGDEILKKCSPRGAIVDLLSSRKSFEQVLQFTKNVYQIQGMCLSEKIQFTRGSGEKSRDEYFKTVAQLSTHYACPWYLDLMSKDLSPSEYHIEYEKYPKFVKIGHNPTLEAREVCNILFSDTDGKEVMFWEEITRNGSIRKLSSLI